MIHSPKFEIPKEPEIEVPREKPMPRPHLTEEEKKLKKVDDYISQRLHALKSHKADVIVVGKVEPVVHKTQIPAPQVEPLEPEGPLPEDKLERQKMEIERKLEMLSKGIITLPTGKSKATLPIEIRRYRRR